jgi:signal transduction histidine kinase/AraC-like DNA-binding protein/ABC-type sugar transport system substrate-binding protein
MSRKSRPTIGLVSTWSMYWGTSVHLYCHELIRGICAAARDHGCNLLIGAGISAGADTRRSRPAWPVFGPDTDFVPVGPWNTDGLIVMPDEATPAQSRYLADLRASGLPVVFAIGEGTGPRVVVDNANGIREAVRHLLGHGHRRIAFIAGKEGRGGDSADRLAAFRASMKEAGLTPHPRLIAFGEHDYSLGYQAMRRILAGRASFTAFVASNDVSCLGAIAALREAGIRVPEDVAAVGFDDVLDARSSRPLLTTIRHPTFTLGYRTVETTLALIRGERPTVPVVVPTRLIVRQSCGCGPDRTRLAAGSGSEPREDGAGLAALMANAAVVESRQSTVAELQAQAELVLTGLTQALRTGDAALARDEMRRQLEATEARGEQPHVWQAAITALVDNWPAAVPLDPAVVDRLRSDVDETVQRATNRARLEHMDMLSELGLVTSKLLAAGDQAEIAETLEAHLPRLGINRFLSAAYLPGDEDDPVGRGEILTHLGLGYAASPFVTRSFPPRGLFPDGEPWQAILLPIRPADTTIGFAAMSTANLEPCAAIANNLGAAMRAIELYRQAVEGRQLAEDADKLKTRFLSTVSHELRTPLSVVVGLGDMVLRETAEGTPLSVDARRDLEHMSASAQHLGRLIGDVLDLASNQAGHLTLVSQPVDLGEVLMDVALAGEQLARDKGLSWSARIPAAATWVIGDRTRLRQVVLNLVGNAVKFTDVGAVSMNAEVSGSEVRVSVSDTGPGVPFEEQGSVFDEFHRSSGAAGRGTGGMGLGLAIARHLVERHGGSIGLESPGRDGWGSTFWFALPLAPAAELAVPAEDRSVVLLVVAASAESIWLHGYLRDRGFAVRVSEVDPAADWSEVLEADDAAALILDEAVAGGRGWDVVKVNKRRSELLKMPVLVCRVDPAGEQGGLVELAHLLEPLEAAEIASELARREPTRRASTRPLVLVVDDDAEMRDLVSRAIRRAGAEPQRADNGREALAAMRLTRPDLVLLDLSMPDMDGFETLAAMHADTNLADVPVVVLTGREIEEADLDRLEGCVAGILTKGVFTVTEIAARVESVLANPAPLGAATQRLVRSAIAYIEAHQAEPIKREDIAGHIAITPDYLTDCFHQELGITPMAFLNRYRIRRARELLDTTDMSVTEVAMATGFGGVSQFTRTFHKAVGISPRAYRRSGRSVSIRPMPPA